MTVGELIKRLERFTSDQPILVLSYIGDQDDKDAYEDHEITDVHDLYGPGTVALEIMRRE